MHGLVHPGALRHEPEVDHAQLGQRPDRGSRSPRAPRGPRPRRRSPPPPSAPSAGTRAADRGGPDGRSAPRPERRSSGPRPARRPTPRIPCAAAARRHLCGCARHPSMVGPARRPRSDMGRERGGRQARMSHTPHMWREPEPRSKLRCCVVPSSQAPAVLAAIPPRRVVGGAGPWGPRAARGSRPVADELGRRFAEAGHELALVGGSVRDALLGRLGDDLDFATAARPEQTLVAPARVGRGRLGPRHRVRHGRRHARRASSSRSPRTAPTRTTGSPASPRSSFGDTLEDDLARRDFTVNAMAVRLPERAVRRPASAGWTTSPAQVLRTPGAPEDSFCDDPLRMMRAARFAAQLGFEVDPAAVAAITEMADRHRDRLRGAGPRRADPS